MKKRISFVFMLMCVLSCLFGLIGCDPGINKLDADELLANTAKIEWVNYTNDDPKIIPINKKNRPIFDFNKTSLIATLDESRFEDIFNDLASIDYLIFETALNEPMGKTLILYQSNGNMIVFYGCLYTNEKGETLYPGDCYVFDKSGVLVEYIGRTGFTFSDWIESEYFLTSP